MFQRAYSLPKDSFFLFGPRATGKTTWLRSVLPSALWIDLLQMREILDLTRSPELFRARVRSRRPVVTDVTLPPHSEISSTAG